MAKWECKTGCLSGADPCILIENDDTNKPQFCPYDMGYKVKWGLCPEEQNTNEFYRDAIYSIAQITGVLYDKVFPDNKMTSKKLQESIEMMQKENSKGC